MAETEDKAEKPKTTRRTTAPRKQAAKKSEKSEKPVVSLGDLRVNTRDSPSVRRLQEALGVNETGTYDATTMQAVRAWQNANGFAGGRGIRLSDEQARRLFGDTYTISA